MSKISKIFLGLLIVAATFSGYSLYNKHYNAVQAPSVVVAPVPAPAVKVEEPKPEMPLEQVLPTIFADEKPKAKQVMKTENTPPKTTAKKAAESAKKGFGVLADGAAAAVDATIDAVKKTGKAIANAKCSSSHSRYNDPECGWVREFLAEGGIPRYQMEYNRTYGLEK